MRILVTGAAGFIGAHTAKALLASGAMRLSVSIISIPITIWHLNSARLDELQNNPRFEFQP